MLSSNSYHSSIPGIRIIFCILLFEFILFVFSGVSLSFLHGDPFFTLQADPASWLLFGFKIPQFIIANHWMGLVLDCAIILLLLAFIRYPENSCIAIILFLLLFLFYITLMGYLTHRNYQFGFFLIFIPFVFRKDMNRYFAFNATRYFILIFYLSAALLKFSNHALFNSSLFSEMLCGQFAPYYLEGNEGIRTALNIYLVNHPGIAYSLFLGSFIIELVVIIGFFTKKYDHWIAILLLGFHFMSWLIMDIAPFGQISFICLLFISNSFKLKPAATFVFKSRY